MPIPGLHRAINRAGAMMMRKRAMAGMTHARSGAPAAHAGPAVFGQGMNALMRRVGLQGAQREQIANPNGRYSQAFREHFIEPLARSRAAIAEWERAAINPDRAQMMNKIETERAFVEIQEALNNHGILARGRNTLPAQRRDLYDLRVMFMKGVQEGQIRNFTNPRAMLIDFHRYLRRFFEEMRQDPEFAHMHPKSSTVYANQAISRFNGSFRKGEFDNLHLAMLNFSRARSR